MEGSKKYKLNLADGKRIGLGAGMALGGALLTYIASVVSQVDFGAYTPIIVALAGILVNAGRKFLKSYE